MEIKQGSSRLHSKKANSPLEAQLAKIIRNCDGKDKALLKRYGYDFVHYCSSNFKLQKIKNIRSLHIYCYIKLLKESTLDSYNLYRSFFAIKTIHKNVLNPRYNINLSKDNLTELGFTELLIDSKKVLVQMILPTSEHYEFLCSYCFSINEYQQSKSYSKWICPNCGSYVGVHQGTKIPLGTTADSITRKYRVIAHNYFDILCKRKMEKTGCSKNVARSKAYKWLSSKLKIEMSQCHIGLMNQEACERVIDLCKPYYQR
ncbi:zinc-finger-containing protein [Paenibacillus sp. FSL L8-0340]|uniref:zinc-finger-containing protein n=1 Tax=Paenibacillus sp. FSL L8-0340 TaxID=2954685 RepID=UPI00315879D9